MSFCTKCGSRLVEASARHCLSSEDFLGGVLWCRAGTRTKWRSAAINLCV